MDPRLAARDRGRPTSRGYILAAWIQGGGAEAAEGDDAEKKTVEVKPTAAAGATEEKKTGGINAIYVTDIDLLSSQFVQMRNEPNLMITKFRFDNVPFVCNLIDAVAGESRFLEIRKRKPKHSTLRMVEYRASEARKVQSEIEQRKQAEYEEAVKKADAEKEKSFAEFKKVFDDLQQKQNRGEEVDPAKIQAAAMQLAMTQRTAERAAEVEKARLARSRDQELAEIERERDRQIQRIQNDYKLQATIFPPILPLLVGLVVWARRRIREREGVSKTRMRL
jgi:ABC-2 type transport system permease protein